MKALKITERFLWILGFVLLGYYLAVWLDQAIYQSYWNWIFDRSKDNSPPSRQLLPNTTLGRLEIDRVGVSVMVKEGLKESTLRRAVGHIPETALPGQAGNVALAGHRDTFFRPLKEIRRNDTILIKTIDDAHVYQVDWTAVVEPERVDLLKPTDRNTLTLVTCYPFSYIGKAPKRFVVRAREIPSTHGATGVRERPRPGAFSSCRF